MSIFLISPISKKPQGFTLIEVLVTISLLSVLLMLAAPNLQDFFIKNKMRRISDDFLQSIFKAKNASVSKNVCTMICASSSTENSAPQCSAKNDGDWQQGWIVFLNPDCDASRNVPQNSQDVFDVRQSLESSYYLKAAAAGSTKIQFDANGRPGLKSSNQFDIYYQAWNSAATERYGMNICMDMLGRARSIPFDKTCSNYK